VVWSWIYDLLISSVEEGLSENVGNSSPEVELSLELAADEIPEFFLTMVESILGWCLTGFEKVGKIGLMTAVVLILVGILLYVIKQNQAEPVSVYEMQ